METEAGMVWYKGLYTGSLIRRAAEDVRKKIDEGKYPPGVFIVTLPPGDAGTLELMPAEELNKDLVRSRIPMIVGLALGKSEAEYLVMKIVQDTWDAQQNADVRHYLQEKDRG